MKRDLVSGVKGFISESFYWLWLEFMRRLKIKKMW